jgi:hypothetical protein
VNDSLQLYRYLNGRKLTFPLDKLLSAFGSHVNLADGQSGLFPLRFEGGGTLLHVDPDANRTYVVEFRPLPQSREFWERMLFMMQSDNIMLVSCKADGPLYANPTAPEHFSREMASWGISPILVSSVEDILQSLKIG